MGTLLHILEFLAFDPIGRVVAAGLAGVVVALRWSPRPDSTERAP